MPSTPTEAPARAEALARLARWIRGLALMLTASLVLGAGSLMLIFGDGFAAPPWFGAVWIAFLVFEALAVVVLFRASRRIRTRDPERDFTGLQSLRALVPYLGFNAVVAGVFLATQLASLVSWGLR